MRERHKQFYKRMGEVIRKLREERGLTIEEVERQIEAMQTEESRESQTLVLIELGMRFREAREQQGLSLEELAKKANVTIGEIQHLEAGTGEIGAAELMDVQIALGLNSEVLWEGLSYDTFDYYPEPEKARQK